MTYKMEDLVPVVAKLANKYNGLDSTSLSYEKAEQFMGAAVFCIRELISQQKNGLVVPGGLSAERAYEMGKECVIARVKKTITMYNELLTCFQSYGNVYLEETILKGFPEFFKWYDVTFAPQDTILTLDYPITKDLSTLQGIDAVYEYLLCIMKEQKYLAQWKPEEIKTMLLQRHVDPDNTVLNICEEVKLIQKEQDNSGTFAL